MVQRLVVAADGENLFSVFCGEHCARIADVGHVAVFADDEDDDGAGTGFVFYFTVLVGFFLETPFGLLETLENCLFWLSRETGLLYHKLMQVVSEEIRAAGASMSVVDAEERAFGPFFVNSTRWFYYIKNYSNSIFIIIPYYSLIRICRISSYSSIRFYRTFRRFMIWNYNFMCRLQRHLVKRFKMVHQCLRFRWRRSCRLSNQALIISLSLFSFIHIVTIKPFAQFLFFPRTYHVRIKRNERFR